MMKIRGLATGVGSLPLKDADKAVDLIFKYLPEIPFWPQLPKRDVREGMVAQFSEGLPGIKVGKEGVYIEEEAKDQELEKFYEDIIVKDTQPFKISPSFAQGLWKFYERLESSDLKQIEFIKCHITGPFTFAASFNDKEGKLLLHDKVFMQIVTKGLIMKALWQIELFRKFGKKIILFLDEPFLSCFGSAYTALNRDEVVNTLKEVAAAIKSADTLVGVHCCGNTDWSILTDIEQVEIINFDAFGFLDKLLLYGQDISRFLQRGGILCWGIVPTQELDGGVNQELLLAKLKSGINAFKDKGVSPDLALERLLISPSCGLGSLDAQRAEAILKLLHNLSIELRKK